MPAEKILLLWIVGRHPEPAAHVVAGIDGRLHRCGEGSAPLLFRSIFGVWARAPGIRSHPAMNQRRFLLLYPAFRSAIIRANPR
ncbi:MAG TPA: hypothetical protein VFR24_24265 [Candidatus Angelobacter sp.]|jgi:hypothetical protein|nr:hypothetical protein [Candidatus Angelobacter sp.]